MSWILKSLRTIFACFLLTCCLAQLEAYSQGVRLTVGTGQDTINLIIVKGTPYEMGYAFGSLMQEEIRMILTRYLNAARSLGDRYTNDTLDAAWKSVMPFTDTRVIDELRGVADGSGMNYQELIRAHMVPVISDYACSGVAAWGDATINGDFYQFRNLDFTTQAGLQDAPVIVIYIPDQGIPHANITFAGYVGCHTGINMKGVVLGEKGETPARDYPFNLQGTHFSTLYRTILYDADSLDAALDILKKTTLIKKYYFYFGDGANKRAAKIKVEAPSAKIWFDNDPADELYPRVFKNIIYHTMDNDVAYQHLQENYGKLDHVSMIKLSRNVASKRGNLVNVVYNASTLELWVAYAEGADDAATRPYVPIKLNDYFSYDFEKAEAAGFKVIHKPQNKNLLIGIVIACVAIGLLVLLWIWKR